MILVIIYCFISSGFNKGEYDLGSIKFDDLILLEVEREIEDFFLICLL